MPRTPDCTASSTSRHGRTRANAGRPSTARTCSRTPAGARARPCSAPGPGPRPRPRSATPTCSRRRWAPDPLPTPSRRSHVGHASSSRTPRWTRPTCRRPRPRAAPPDPFGLTRREHEVLGAGRPWPHEPADRRRAVHQREHRGRPRLEHPGQARRVDPNRGRRGRRAAGHGRHARGGLTKEAAVVDRGSVEWCDGIRPRRRTPAACGSGRGGAACAAPGPRSGGSAPG